MAKKTKDLEENKTKKVTNKKTTTKKAAVVKEKTYTKKSATTKAKAKTTTKKPATKKTTKKAITKKTVYAAEYYDLPYSYNKTTVKLLAQTPTTLFVYWELAESDYNELRKKYGEDFFNVTKPILIVYNDTLNYSFEIEINDFANSWYIHVNDSNCEYHIELGRKPIPVASKPAKSLEQQSVNQTSSEKAYIPYYIYITSSNNMSSPNDKILFNPNLHKIKFRNIKTGQIKEKNIDEFRFIANIGIFNIKELYKHLFPNENIEFENFLSGNNSSGNPSSGSFSSRFK